MNHCNVDRNSQHKCKCVCVHVCVQVCVHVCVQVCVQVCVHVCVLVCVFHLLNAWLHLNIIGLFACHFPSVYTRNYTG